MHIRCFPRISCDSYVTFYYLHIYCRPACVQTRRPTHPPARPHARTRTHPHAHPPHACANYFLFLRSHIDIGNEIIEEANVDELINSVFNSAGLQNKQELSADDFSSLLGEYSTELHYASFDFDGSTFSCQ